MSFPRRRFASVLLVLSWATFSFPSWTQTTKGPDRASTFAVGAQYDTTHVYVSPPTLMRSLLAFSEPLGVKARSRSSPR